ncbi:hypothetical protein Esti_006405 [Eimeria stiedai]
MHTRLPRLPPRLLLLGSPHQSHCQDASAWEGLAGPPCRLGASRCAHCRSFRAATAAARRRQQEQQQKHARQPPPSAAAASGSVKRSLETLGASSLRRHFEWDMRRTALGGPSTFRGPRASRGPPRIGLNDAGDRSGDRETRLLVSEAVEASRLGVGSASYWEALARRAQELARFLGAADIAALLHAVSRGSRGAGEETAAACGGLGPRLEALLPQMSSLQLTQVISALARLQVPASPALLQRVRQRLECLLAGDAFQQPSKVAMLLSACSKLRLADPALMEQLAAYVTWMLERGGSPFRDLAIIAKALASSPPLRSHAVFVCIAEAAIKNLNEATCLDLARLLQAFAAAAAHRASWPEQQEQQQQQQADSVGNACREVSAGLAAVAPSFDKAAFASAHRRLFSACIEAAGDRIAGASPAELSVAAQAFGVALVDSHGPDTKALASVLDSIRRVSVASLELFLPQHVACLLLTFARWRLPFPPIDLLKVIRRLSQLSRMQEETAAAAAPRAAAAPAAAGVAPWPHHPLFFAAGSAAPVSIDTTTRISCLFSLGVLLRPCAAAAAACRAQQTGSGASNEAAGALLRSDLCSSAPAASSQAQQQQATDQATAAAGAPAAQALEAAERLFEEWIDPIFRDLSQRPRCQTNGGDMQPVLRLAEALVNCTFLRDAQRVVGPLQQLVLQRHRSLDPVTSSKLLHLFRLLGLPEGHDLLLLLQQQAEQLQGSVAAAKTAGRRAQPLTVVGLPRAACKQQTIQRCATSHSTACKQQQLCCRSARPQPPLNLEPKNRGSARAWGGGVSKETIPASHTCFNAAQAD